MDHQQPPLSRREARRQQTSAEQSEPLLVAASVGTTPSAQEPARTPESLSDGADGSSDGPTDRKRRRRRRRWWIWSIIVVLLIAVLVAGGLAAKRLYDQAMTVRADLEAAISEVQTVKSAVLSGDLDSASAASDRLSVHTSAAVSGSHGRLWSIAENVPIVGNNLTAVREITEITHNLATDVVAPASAVSFSSFQPKEGRIDLDAIASLSSLLDQVDAGTTAAISALDRLDRDGLIDQVSAAVAQLDEALAEITPLIAPARDIVGALPHALGADGPRDYLLMFQGNSEARSLGGNAAIFIVLRAEDGQLAIIDEIASQDFRNAPPRPILDLDPDAVNIYGDKIGRYTADFTMVPDFPEAVRILDAWWEREGFTPYDAVLSFDPVALSYLLEATGPVELLTGDTLDSQNAASLLLNGAYFKYEDPFEQNVFFASAAGSVFSAITSGGFEPLAFVTGLSRAASEGRLLYWSDDPRETELIAGSRLQGVMPSSKEEQTAIGVFINDNTGSKMSYYLDMAIDACLSDTSMRGEVTLQSNITSEDAQSLPRYIRGPYFKAGNISTYMAIYGPRGTSLSDIKIDGNPARILASGEHLGRPVVKVEVRNRFVSSHTVQFTFVGLQDDTKGLEVQHTPMVRDTAISLSATCAR